MYVKIAAPDVSPGGARFASHMLRAAFTGSDPGTFASRTLSVSFLRLADLALAEYRAGSASAKEFWDVSDRLMLGKIAESIAHFETCVVTFHRAIRCFRRLRALPDLPPLLKEKLRSEKAPFATDPLADPIMRIRDHIQHLDERLFYGEIIEGQTFFLVLEGDETPVDGEPGQTLKTFDRLSIGPDKLTLQQLADGLANLSRFADKITEFQLECRQSAAPAVGPAECVAPSPSATVSHLAEGQ